MEIPPHGCGLLWPRMIRGVAEWRWGCRNRFTVGQSLERTFLVFPVRGQSPVGNSGGAGFPMPAHSSQLRPRSCRGVREGAICGVWSYHLYSRVKTWDRLRLVGLEKLLPHSYIPILEITQPIFAGHNIKSRKENSINIVYVI